MKKLFLIMSMLCISLSVFASDANRIYIGFEGGTYTYREPHMEYTITVIKSVLLWNGLAEVF